MSKVIKVFIRRENFIYRAGSVVYSPDDSIYFNFGTKHAQRIGLHDSYHASTAEIHQGRSNLDPGTVAPFKAPEGITSPILFGNTTGAFASYRISTLKPVRSDIVLQCLTGKVSHPVFGVYLEPTRSYMVRYAYSRNPPCEVMSIHTRRLTPVLDVTVVHVSVKETFGGLISFDSRFTSKTLRTFYRRAGAWESIGIYGTTTA